MEHDSEAAVVAPRDRRLIPGIFNYCHRWCERCPFTDRCGLFRDNLAYDRAHPESDVFEQIADSFQKPFEVLAAWCEREGIDFEKLQEDADTEEATAAEQRLNEAIDADPVLQAAKEYGHRTLDIVKALREAERVITWSPRFRAAVETIEWYAPFISVKIHRALHGQGGAEADGHDEGGLQSDWNLTGKTARMAIADSRRAWKIVLEAGDAPPLSPVRELDHLLARIESGLAERFPQSMDAVRPGFDEPEIAAGAMATLDCFELRPWQPGAGGSETVED